MDCQDLVQPDLFMRRTLPGVRQELVQPDLDRSEYRQCYVVACCHLVPVAGESRAIFIYFYFYFYFLAS
jgi:hypothetical protein